MTKVLVTGASGFIGAALVNALRDEGVETRGAYRSSGARPGDSVTVGEIGAATDWSRALDGVDAVAHLAGIAHARASDADYWRVIAEGSARLVDQARAAGVNRFVFISSIKAVADRSHGAPVCETTTPAPESAYGRAKLAAERAVLAERALAPVVLRPPLTIAADARANFGALLRLAASGAPLPLGGLRAKRSLIARGALVEAVKAALARPAACGVFHVATGPALTAGAMVRALRDGMRLPARLFPAPGLGRLLPAGLREELVVDDTVFRDAIGYGAWGLDAEAALREIGRTWKTSRR